MTLRLPSNARLAPGLDPWRELGKHVNELYWGDRDRDRPPAIARSSRRARQGSLRLKHWLNIAASDNHFACAACISRETLAVLATETAPGIPIFDTRAGRVIGSVESYEMRGAELWARCALDDRVDLGGTHPEAVIAQQGPVHRLLAVMVTSLPRGMLGEVVGDLK